MYMKIWTHVTTYETLWRLVLISVNMWICVNYVIACTLYNSICERMSILVYTSIQNTEIYRNLWNLLKYVSCMTTCQALEQFCSFCIKNYPQIYDCFHECLTKERSCRSSFTRDMFPVMGAFLLLDCTKLFGTSFTFSWMQRW